MDYPLRREFKINMNINRRSSIYYFLFSNRITLEFTQGTIEQTIDFFNSIEGGDTKLIERLINFIRKHQTRRLRWINTRIVSKLVELNAETLLTIVKKNYLRGVFNDKPTNTQGRGGLFSGQIVILSEKLNIDPDNLIKKYTFEQMLWLTEGIVFNSNELTKEGKKKNDRIMNQKRLGKKDIDHKTIEEFDKESQKAVSDFRKKYLERKKAS